MKSNFKKIVFLGFFSLFFLPDFSLAIENFSFVKNGYSRIFYYREGKEARNSLFTYPSSIDVLAPQSYSIDVNGALEGGIKQDILDFTSRKKIKVMPLVTNGSFSRREAEAFLDNTRAQETAINLMVLEAKEKKFSGWQLDFEQISASYKDKYSAFAKLFGDKMKENNLVSSVAVVSKISDNPEDYKKDLWNNLIGVYDFSALASATDFISLMSYDDPDSKGPIARYSWLNKVLDYSLIHVPKEKLSLGIAFYYWRRHDPTQKIYGIGGYKTMKNYINKYKMTKGYSAVEKAPYMTYKSQGVGYTIWYENAKSIGEKLELAKSRGIKSFSAWAIGLEYPDVYTAISKWKKGII